ncbi:cytochrome c oxidase subunit VIIc domain-containing protein [Phthorimaea operculella]|nr:cytochrome c oxidase subunit VIIc domain-containing protein [Phthorimaea operculella]
MSRLRYLTSTSISAIRSFLRLQQLQPITIKNVPVRLCHHSGPPQPFDNMPFRVTSRYALTVVFSILYGVGLWAPFLIVWYSMAKRTL